MTDANGSGSALDELMAISTLTHSGSALVLTLNSGSAIVFDGEGTGLPEYGDLFSDLSMV